MCFYNDDYDWLARVVRDEVTTAAKPTTCYECHQVIPEGAWVRHIFQQEHEICIHSPRHDDYDGPETDLDDCPPDCEHDYGMYYGYYRCQVCEQLIEAIHQHEIKEGCHEAESRPALTGLPDAMHENGRAYLVEAEAMYPGITAALPERYRVDDDEVTNA